MGDLTPAENPNRPQYASRRDMERLSRRFEELRDGLIGNVDFPGGELGRIRAHLTLVSGKIDALPTQVQTLAAAETAAELHRQLLRTAVKIITWVLGVVALALGTYIAWRLAH